MNSITGNLWERMCRRQFPKEPRQEFEAWREMFERCTAARQKKLDFLSEKLNNSYKNASAPGTDVMITIFANFWRKKWRISKKNCYDQIFAKQIEV
jgi:hypothetical protein